MEPLLKQLRELPKMLSALPAGLRMLLGIGVLAAIGAALYNAVVAAENWPYAFTNLSPEDSAEVASTLKASQVPFRLDSGGSALAVPASKVYDARLLLAAAGLPRGGGVGFEIFDRGDLGVSEFTQRVNLRRATEGELARTVGRLAQVRSARVHLTLPEKGLFRDDDRKPSAAVVVNLQPGRTLDDRELAGIRHLVASAVPSLSPSGVTVVDGRGTVLAAETPWSEAQAWQLRMERDLERRAIELLEQAVGAGSVIARVTASVDASEVATQAETVDPDATALRSERRVSQAQMQNAQAPNGVAGAAGNQPMSPQPAGMGTLNQGTSSTQDDIKNYEVSKTTTSTTVRMPRVKKLSVAVLIDGVQGKPRPAEEMARLSELAKRAVGFDAARGDEIDVSSAPFTRSEEPPVTPPPASKEWIVKLLTYAGGAIVGLLALSILARMVRAGGPQANSMGTVTLTPGARVSEIEALAHELPQLAGPAAAPGASDPARMLRDRAKDLAQKDPSRAAHILKAWMSNETGPGGDNG
jgi:flagellar M-ring protein FliF